MDRTIFGIPLPVFALGLFAGIYGFMWIRKRQPSATGQTRAGTPPGQPAFSQQQEVQDFQIYSALTGQQQGADLNFLSEVASLFQGGASGGTSVPASTPAQTAPANTGTAPPTTTASPGSTQSQSPAPASSSG